METHPATEESNSTAGQRVSDHVFVYNIVVAALCERDRFPFKWVPRRPRPNYEESFRVCAAIRLRSPRLRRARVPPSMTAGRPCRRRLHLGISHRPSVRPSVRHSCLSDEAMNIVPPILARARAYINRICGRSVDHFRLLS